MGLRVLSAGAARDLSWGSNPSRTLPGPAPVEPRGVLYPARGAAGAAAGSAAALTSARLCPFPHQGEFPSHQLGSCTGLCAHGPFILTALSLGTTMGYGATGAERWCGKAFVLGRQWHPSRTLPGPAPVEPRGVPYLSRGAAGAAAGKAAVLTSARLCPFPRQGEFPSHQLGSCTGLCAHGSFIDSAEPGDHNGLRGYGC